MPEAKEGWVPPEMKTFLVRITAAWSIMTFILVCCCTATAVLYLILYWQMIPSMLEMQAPLYFDFDENQLGQLGFKHLTEKTETHAQYAMPKASLDLVYAEQQWVPVINEKRHRNNEIEYRYGTAQQMSTGFRYDIWFEMSIPDFRKVRRTDLGNFMVMADLIDKHNKTVARSRRPVLVAPGLLPKQTRSWLWAPVSILGWFWPFSAEVYDERVSIKLMCFERFLELERNKISNVVIQLSSPLIELFEARLIFKCKLSGILYYMYHWRLSTFMSFMISCCGIQAIISYSLVGFFGLVNVATLYSEANNRKRRGRSASRGRGIPRRNLSAHDQIRRRRSLSRPFP